MSYFFTPPLAIKDLPADHLHAGGPYRTPQFIFLHASAGKSSGAWLSTSPQSRVSCNRLIEKDGTNYKIVADGTNAWTQGYGVMGPYGPPHTTVHTVMDDGTVHEYQPIDQPQSGGPCQLSLRI
jgi:hypothetical protein